MQNRMVDRAHKSRLRCKPRFQLLLILLPVLLIACGHSQLSLQPEIKAPRPSANQKTSDLSPQTMPALSPDQTGAEHARLGDLMLLRGDLQSAYLHYEKALQMAPDDLDLVYKKGLTLLRAGNHAEAARQFQSVIDNKGTHALAHEGLGRALFMQEKIDDGKTHFLQAVTLNERLWLSHNYLGTIYDREGRVEEAVAAYRAAIAIEPHNGLVYNNLGISYLQAGEYAQAVRAFQEAIARRFAGEKIYNNMGLALAYLGRPEAAFEAFKKAGGEPKAYNNLGCFFMEIGQFEKAVTCFEKAIAAEPAFYVTAGDNLKRAQASLRKI